MVDMEEPLSPAEEIEKSGKVVLYLGVGMVGMTWGIAILHLISAAHVTSTCNTSLAVALRKLAIVDAVMGCVVLGGVLGMRAVFKAVSDVATARSEGRDSREAKVDAQSTHAKYATTLRGAVRTALAVQGVLAVIWLVLAGFAVPQAYGASLEKCQPYPVIAFYPIAILNFVVMVVNAFVYKCADV